jgi:hypothetical protein
LGLGHGTVAGQVKHPNHLPLRVAQRYRSTGEGAEPVQVVLAAVDLDRPSFHQCSANRIGATQRFAPATAGSDVAQAGYVEELGLAFNHQYIGLSITQDY